MSEEGQGRGRAAGGAKSGRGQGSNGGGDGAWRATVDARLSALEKDVAAINERTKHLATKEEVRTGFQQIQTDLQRLRADLVESQNRQLRWIIGGMGAMLLTVVGTVAPALFQ